MQLTSLLRRAGLWTRFPTAPVRDTSPSPRPVDRAAADPLGRRRAGRTDAPWPVLLGPERAPAIQVDGTTCGAAVLVLLAADGDPAVAAWLDAGTGRFDALQRAVQRRTTRTALLGLPWPRALGTPPWAAARTARWGAVRYGHRVVDDTDPADLARVRAAVDAALARGILVPLYTGGDTAGGVGAAVPRHVVLALPGGPDGVHLVYEPGSGAVHAVPRAALWAAERPLDALGRWTHVVWALLPR
ncbi:hypothetical protein GCM10023221_00560 [Luteimicrobium xylanilyticum]|uniref:Peptidase C39-like domain-containing protein n=1 Tax=Luteimicrobium xylanilyticum TaxID=1133546 RepID=A0A5P9Q891_9MICO|nr:hypothetical protein [Luteimicrobium xylanilyticum]QFU97647.1 hypothetical protein KDY119_01146 [Luteimicrobium xylanilyticum]